MTQRGSAMSAGACREKNFLRGEWNPARGVGRQRRCLARLLAGWSGFDRGQAILRPQRTMWSLHRHRGRQGGAVLSGQAHGNLNGSKVITVEGLGTPDNPHPDPARIRSQRRDPMRLLYSGPDHGRARPFWTTIPIRTRPLIKKALQHNLCRCTGYVKIFDAVKLAGRLLRGETTLEEVTPKASDGNHGGVPSPAFRHGQGLRRRPVHGRLQNPGRLGNGRCAQRTSPCPDQVHRRLRRPGHARRSRGS